MFQGFSQARDVSAGGAFGVAGEGTKYLAGARVKAGADAATVVIRETNGSGRILAVLGAGIGLCDEWRPTKPVAYTAIYFVTTTGTAPIVIAYEG